MHSCCKSSKDKREKREQEAEGHRHLETRDIIWKEHTSRSQWDMKYNGEHGRSKAEDVFGTIIPAAW